MKTYLIISENEVASTDEETMFDAWYVDLPTDIFDKYRNDGGSETGTLEEILENAYDTIQ